LPSTGPVIVQQPGGVQLILRTPAGAQQQTHTAQVMVSSMHLHIRIHNHCLSYKVLKMI